MNSRQFFRLVKASLLASAVGACGARAHIAARNSALALAPTCADAVRVYPDREHVPYDYYEVATHATVKVLGVALGAGDAERKARAIAIWMPSDTAGVREACSGK